MWGAAHGHLGSEAFEGYFAGRHEIHFSGPGETVTLQHAAHSHDTFAAGALRAAAWLVDRRPGSYTMRDVIA